MSGRGCAVIAGGILLAVVGPLLASLLRRRRPRCTYTAQQRIEALQRQRGRTGGVS